MDALVGMLALATGVVVLATSGVSLVLTIRNNRTTQQIHVLVNSRMARMVSRVDQLAEALEASGVEVPPPDEDDV